MRTGLRLRGTKRHKNSKLKGKSAPKKSPNPKPAPQQLKVVVAETRGVNVKAQTTMRCMCDGSCQKAKRGTYLGTNDASNFKRHLVSHHGGAPCHW